MKDIRKVLFLILAFSLIACANDSDNNREEDQLTYKIVDTYQTKTFDNFNEITPPKEGEKFYGQDAEYNGNEPSYKDNDNGTISDNVTGLMWQKGYKTLTYKEALEELERLNKEDKYNDWRLPSIKQLYSLIDFRGEDPSGIMMGGVSHDEIPFINEEYFDFEYGSNGERIIDTQLLSDTLYTGLTMRGDITVFGLNVADGRIKGYPMTMPGGKDKAYTVRFVRGNEEYGINKFRDNEDGTITDEATGLMWSASDSGVAMSWEEAFDYVAKLNEENYLGYSDWKMPDAKELQSIVDYTKSPQTTSSPAIDDMFDVTKITVEEGVQDYPFYFTSTTHKNSSENGGDAAVYICFGEALGFLDGVLTDVHGAGAQRSDKKTGNASDFPQGFGPQGDVIRINHFVRVVREN